MLRQLARCLGLDQVVLLLLLREVAKVGNVSHSKGSADVR